MKHCAHYNHQTFKNTFFKNIKKIVKITKNTEILLFVCHAALLTTHGYIFQKGPHVYMDIYIRCISVYTLYTHIKVKEFLP